MVAGRSGAVVALVVIGVVPAGDGDAGEVAGASPGAGAGGSGAGRVVTAGDRSGGMVEGGTVDVGRMRAASICRRAPAGGLSGLRAANATERPATTAMTSSAIAATRVFTWTAPKDRRTALPRPAATAASASAGRRGPGRTEGRAVGGTSATKPATLASGSGPATNGSSRRALPSSPGSHQSSWNGASAPSSRSVVPPPLVVSPQMSLVRATSGLPVVSDARDSPAVTSPGSPTGSDGGGPPEFGMTGCSSPQTTARSGSSGTLSPGTPSSITTPRYVVSPWHRCHATVGRTDGASDTSPQAQLGLDQSQKVPPWL